MTQTNGIFLIVDIASLAKQTPENHFNYLICKNDYHNLIKEGAQ